MNKLIKFAITIAILLLLVAEGKTNTIVPSQSYQAKFLTLIPFMEANKKEIPEFETFLKKYDLFVSKINAEHINVTKELNSSPLLLFKSKEKYLEYIKEEYASSKEWKKIDEEMKALYEEMLALINRFIEVQHIESQEIKAEIENIIIIISSGVAIYNAVKKIIIFQNSVRAAKYYQVMYWKSSTEIITGEVDDINWALIFDKNTAKKIESKLKKLEEKEEGVNLILSKRV